MVQHRDAGSLLHLLATSNHLLPTFIGTATLQSLLVMPMRERNEKSEGDAVRGGVYHNISFRSAETEGEQEHVIFRKV